MANTPETKTDAVPVTVMDRIIDQGHIIRDDSQRPYAMTLVSEYATQVLDEGMTVNKQSALSGIKQRIAEIDQTVSDQLNAIMHSEAFQAVVWHLFVSHPDLKVNQTKWESTR